jgi:tetratricopeptide (TPR) repeat protein
MSQTSRPESSFRFRNLLIIVLLATIFGAWWKWGRVKPESQIDMTAVMRENSRGVGYMEQFDFPPAVNAFEEVVHLAPNWEVGKINLGIALMNVARGEDLPPEESEQAFARAIQLFNEVLQRHPKNPHAHFCLGLIVRWRGKVDDLPQALEHFQAVADTDDRDAFTWYNLGSISSDLGRSREECIGYYRKAIQFDPYHTAALQGLHDLLRLDNKDAEADRILKESEALRSALWNTPTKDKYYSDRGRYCQVISTGPDKPDDSPPVRPPLFLRDDKLHVELAPGARWATAQDFGNDATAELRRVVRSRFGAVMVVLDYNGDGKPDLFMLGAVTENGKVRDLLLRNDGGGRFTDVTREAGLATPFPSLGCVVGDFDNDKRPDLFITGAGEQRLFRNNGMGGFTGVTKEAGLDGIKAVCLGAAFVDLDQDSDLDLVVAEYAATPEQALDMLRGKANGPGEGFSVYINVGAAPPETAKDDPPPLQPGFRRDDALSRTFGAGSTAVCLAASDLDMDWDLDLVTLADGKPPGVSINDRLLRFRGFSLPEEQAASGAWNGVLVLDVNRDERSDLLLLGSARRPLLLLHRPVPGEPDVTKWFEAIPTDSPPLRHAQAVDIDLDGSTDVIGLSQHGKPVLLHNHRGRLTFAPEALGRDESWPSDLVAIATADFDCDGRPDFVVWSESGGLQLFINQGNGYHGLKLDLVGYRRIHSQDLCRTNADGFGARVSVLAGQRRACAEYTTLSAGLGQSHQPLQLGLGEFTEPDVIRIRWPDLIIQAEFNSIAPNECRVIRIDQDNRKKTSCPILFTWDGERYTFISDFLGAGAIGEYGPDRRTRKPRPEESIKIDPGRLVGRNGKYLLKIANPMDEVHYFDRLQLAVIDHPPEIKVFPDERFVTLGDQPSQDFLAFKDEIHPVKASDHRGRDVTAKLRAMDRDTVDGFAKRGWVGYAEEHWVELDFGDRLSKFGPNDRLILCLGGWTDYPYPEAMWAATQAGIALQHPVLERKAEDGNWQPILADAGFPAGLTRMTTVDVTGKLAGPRCTVRLRCNMHVYWDQIFVAPLIDRVAKSDEGKSVDTPRLRVRRLDVDTATLATRGCVQEHSPDGKQPTVYDHDRIASVPVARQAGCLTRFGDVTELLRSVDDRFAIFGPGDEISVSFDATSLPELPTGWKRSFVLRSWGYTKSSSMFVAFPDTLEPLPFQAMRNYPYAPDEHYPNDAEHEEYRKNYNTRAVGTSHGKTQMNADKRN